MESAGIWMLGSVAVLVIATGLPAFVVLVGVAVLFATLGLAAGELSLPLLTALSPRVVGLLESDLLQALPLYALMGALLDRLPLADILFRAGTRVFRRSPAAPLAASLGLGALLAPMNGSVGASVAALARVVHPRLRRRGVAPDKSLAVICVASTLGVVVPPSLILILLGDAMLRAHTEAVNATHRLDRIINTQDVFRGALPAAALFLLLAFLLVLWLGRRAPQGEMPAEPRLGWRDGLIALAVVGAILFLLAAVASGVIYAVEGAATGAVVLFLCGLASGHLHRAALREVLRATMAVTGALFALFVAATTFTLVLRAFGTDRLLDAWITSLPGGASGAVTAVLLLLGLCAFVLDAFEIIFVVIPVVMPPLLIQAPDAVWVAVLALLALQASFLLPPIGYAVMMARTMTGESVTMARLMRALIPFLAIQVVVLALTIAVPGLTHLIAPSGMGERGQPPSLTDEEVRRQFELIRPEPPEEE